jgi:hypothetical protein
MESASGEGACAMITIVGEPSPRLLTTFKDEVRQAKGLTLPPQAVSLLEPFRAVRGG